MVFACRTRWNAIAVTIVQSTPTTGRVVNCSSNGIPSRMRASPYPSLTSICISDGCDALEYSSMRKPASWRSLSNLACALG